VEIGAKTDMLTNRPVEAVAAEKRAIREKEEQIRLARESEKLGLTQGPDGILLQRLIEKVAIARIEKLVAEDREMQAYVSILKEMGHTESLARKAYEKLHGRHLEAVPQHP
jgi:hypothetical protein